tara:strand:+ start:330 stop:2216 length:1887 start_codon:yes stop_codon:yes gene_type:complete
MALIIGNLTLWLSLIFSISQFISLKKNTNLKIISISIVGLLITSISSFLILIYSYLISDFSILNVFQNSHTTKPLIYKLSAAWGNHEGSMLLWILVLTLFNFLIYKLLSKKNSLFILKTLEIQIIIIIGFILFTILTSNPFEKVIPVPKNGLGFNPILQDPALAIHPPLLYIGYVGFSAVFSMSVATLIFGDSQKFSWYLYMKPFVLVAWTFLSIGIALGSIWAYYELGWGGWWFWDPVENASFMPWLLGTALLHSLIIVQKKKSLQAWVLLLGILTFLLSVIGTFLVRSGILTSVHTFALDPSRGMYILILTIILGAYSLFLFGTRSKLFLDKNYFSFFSREGSILINNIFMVIVCGIVFLGTVYPLAIEAFTNNKISVGKPYFNSTVIPIIIPAIFIMGVAPIMSWGKNEKFIFFKRNILPVIITLLISTFIFLYYQSFSTMGFFGIVIGFWLIVNNIIVLYKKDKSHSFGMVMAHLGIGLIIIGITASSVWQIEKITKMNVKDEVRIEKYNIGFDKINEVKGQNYIALQGNFLVYDDKKNIIAELKPENRFYPITKIFTSEVSIHTNLFRDLYIVLGNGSSKDGWVVKIYYNPLVIWIWIGSFLVFFGGLISIKNNLINQKTLYR